MAAGFTVPGGRGRIGHQVEVGGANRLINQGTIQADVAGQTLVVQLSSTGSLTNEATLEASNGAVLSVSRLSANGRMPLAGFGDSS